MKYVNIGRIPACPNPAMPAQAPLGAYPSTGSGDNLTILTRLYADPTMYAASWLRSVPLNRDFRRPPKDFIHPKTSSTSLRFL